MGVSNLTYLGGKLAEANPLQRAAALQPARDAAQRELDDLKAQLGKARQDLQQARAAAAADPPPADKAALDAEVGRLTKEVERLEGTRAAPGGETGGAQKRLDDLDKALKDALAGAVRG